MIARGMRLSAGLLFVVLAARAAVAEPVTLRFASLVPEGTAWARELRAFARDVENLSHGNLRVKWYFGGITGAEPLQIGAVAHKAYIDVD